ncbi:hypothetical protein TMEN_5057 [Trichophyton mentagrophytes]|nr:hypothetical protein TMEN_5057 [Trichophyton mentagrophytes]
MLLLTPSSFTGVGHIVWEDHLPKIYIKNPCIATILKRVNHDYQPSTVTYPGVLYRDLQRAFVHPDTTKSEKDTLGPLINNTKGILQLGLSNLRREHGRGICDFNSIEAKQRYWGEAIYQHYGKACIVHVFGGDIRPHDDSGKNVKCQKLVFLNGLNSLETGLQLSFSLKEGESKYEYTLFSRYNDLPYLSQLGVQFPMDYYGRRTVVTSPLYLFSIPNAVQETVHVGDYSEVKWRLIRDDGVETRSDSFPSKALQPEDKRLLQNIETGRVAMLHLHPTIVGDDIQVVQEGTSMIRLKHEYFLVIYLDGSPSSWFEKAFTVGAPFFIRLLASSSPMYTEILKEAEEQLGEDFFLGRPDASGHRLEEGDNPAYNLDHRFSSQKTQAMIRFVLGIERRLSVPLPSEHAVWYSFDSVILFTGFDEGVSRMKLGEICSMTVTSDRAYGDEGLTEYIPPNSDLVFVVRLLRINDKTWKPNARGNLLETVLYGCTFKDCFCLFTNFDAWVYHEKSKHCELEYWRCPVFDQSGEECAKLSERLQGFEEHLKIAHKSNPYEYYLKNYHIGGDYQGKHWCGFCGFSVPSGKGAGAMAKRYEHVSDHFKDGRSITEWLDAGARLPNWTEVREGVFTVDGLPPFDCVIFKEGSIYRARAIKY